MKNEVFKNVTQTVEAFQADYQAKLQAAEDHLQQETKKKAEAEAKAAAAVAADDQATWKKADKDHRRCSRHQVRPGAPGHDPEAVRLPPG